MEIDIFQHSQKRISNKIYIRYSWFEWLDLDLKTLGESLIGFNSVIPEILSNTKLNGEIKVSVVDVNQGSIIFWVELQVILTVLEAFRNIKELHEFLQVIDPEQIKNLHTTINHFASENPVDYDIIKLVIEIIAAWGLWKYLINLLNAGKDQKQTPITQWDGYDLPSRVAESLHRSITKNSFRKAFKPFVEARIQKLQVAPTLDFTEQDISEITIQSFGDYLSENQEILPQLNNWDKITVQWKLIGLQSSKWDSMKVRFAGYPKNMRDFICYPESWTDTKDFRSFFKEDNLKMELEVVRESKYVKPRFIVHNMERSEITLNV